MKVCSLILFESCRLVVGPIILFIWAVCIQALKKISIKVLRYVKCKFEICIVFVSVNLELIWFKLCCQTLYLRYSFCPLRSKSVKMSNVTFLQRGSAVTASVYFLLTGSHGYLILQGNPFISVTLLKRICLLCMFFAPCNDWIESLCDITKNVSSLKPGAVHCSPPVFAKWDSYI